MHMKVTVMSILEHVNLMDMVKLSHQSLDDLKVGARIEAGEQKKMR